MLPRSTPASRCDKRNLLRAIKCQKVIILPRQARHKRSEAALKNRDLRGFRRSYRASTTQAIAEATRGRILSRASSLLPRNSSRSGAFRVPLAPSSPSPIGCFTGAGKTPAPSFGATFFRTRCKRGSIHQDRLGTNFGKVEKREIAFRRGSAADPHSGAAPRVALSFAAADPSFEPGYFARKTEQVNKRKRVFFCKKRYRFKLNKSIILPRQARDEQFKYGDSSTQK